MEIIIDQFSGFCFGVVSAIKSAEKELKESKTLYCLGDIVHNGMEVKRLAEKGLQVISYTKFHSLSDCKVLIRAHGEPPITYNIAKERNISLIDATCPIVLELQKKVKDGYIEMKRKKGQVVIFGTKGHAEVLALQGQTNNTAIVITNKDELNILDFTKPIRLYSQTTKNKDEYADIVNAIKSITIPDNIDFISYDTICKKVANRSNQLKDFTKNVDTLVFTSGKNSSNGLYLYKICKEVLPNSFFISEPSELKKEWFINSNIIGITGATPTPMWLMEEVSLTIKSFFE